MLSETPSVQDSSIMQNENFKKYITGKKNLSFSRKLLDVNEFF